jgi:hypothetical protein
LGVSCKAGGHVMTAVRYCLASGQLQPYLPSLGPAGLPHTCGKSAAAGYGQQQLAHGMVKAWHDCVRYASPSALPCCSPVCLFSSLMVPTGPSWVQ